MISKLFQVLVWAKKKGEVKALNRIQMKVLSTSIRESLYLKEVKKTTTCSDAYLQTVIQAAEKVIGQRCPIRL